MPFSSESDEKCTKIANKTKKQNTQGVLLLLVEISGIEPLTS